MNNNLTTNKVTIKDIESQNELLQSQYNELKCKFEESTTKTKEFIHQVNEDKKEFEQHLTSKLDKDAQEIIDKELKTIQNAIEHLRQK